MSLCSTDKQDEENDRNHCGFNSYTKKLLIGIGKADIVDNFKKKDIATEELCMLTKEDLIELGVPNEEVKEVHDSLKLFSRHSFEGKLEEHYRQKFLIDILNRANYHLKLIKTYILYYNTVLSKNDGSKINNDAKVSEDICQATNSVIKEYDLMQKDYIHLRNTLSKKTKKDHTRLYIAISALGMAGSVIFYLYNR